MAGKEVGSYMVRFSSQVGSYTITSMVRAPPPPIPTMCATRIAMMADAAAAVMVNDEW
jgi:hypothetical protein